MQLIKNNKLGSIYIDVSGNLSAIGAVMLVEEAVTELLGNMELDGISLERKYGAVWVYTKTRVKLLKDIKWDAPYTLTSFISRKSRAGINIDVAIENENKELCSYARVELCAIDVKELKIRRTNEVGVDDSIEAHEPWIDFSFARYTKVEYEKVDEVKIKFSNIDFMKHTNNKEYVRFIMDTYTVDELLCKPIKELEVVYYNQSYEGNILSISKTVNESSELFTVERDETIIVKAEIIR